MRCRCPACGAETSLDALVVHAEASQALATALSMTPLGKLLVQYLGLFRPAQSALSFDRVNKLLGELLAMIDKGEVERNHRSWPAPQQYWIAALELMLGKRATLTLPLKGHGYLLEIIAGFGNKAEGEKEEKREEQRRNNPEGKRSSSLAGDDFHEQQRKSEEARQKALASLGSMGKKLLSQNTPE